MLVVFQGQNIRRTLHNGEWYFSIIDIVKALTKTPNPSDYLKKVRKRDEALNEGWGQFVTPLKIQTPGGPQSVNCVNVESAFRIIQSIPSKKAEPMKRWLARVGYERVQEIENPELAQKRMKTIYRLKGYSDQWIEKRVRGIAIRDELTDEWKKRGVKRSNDFAILTSEISKATFDMTPKEYKEFKGLKQQNLRDHMDDIELILTMLGEASTTRFTKERNSEKFPGLKKDAKDGGDVAGTARKHLEKKLGKSVMSRTSVLDHAQKSSISDISEENYLKEPEKTKRIEKR